LTDFPLVQITGTVMTMTVPFLVEIFFIKL
jgi:hypothetical protein